MSVKFKKKMLLLTAVAIANRKICVKSKKKRWHIRPINRNREKYGRFLTTFKCMKENDPEEFFAYTRLHVEEFNMLLNLIHDSCVKRSMRSAITVEERLAITLRQVLYKIKMQKDK